MYRVIILVSNHAYLVVQILNPMTVFAVHQVVYLKYHVILQMSQVTSISQILLESMLIFLFSLQREIEVHLLSMIINIY